MSRFEETMSGLGYELDEVEDRKLTYKKNAKYSILVLVIDLGLKYVNMILVPKSVIMRSSDLVMMQGEFENMIRDAELIVAKSNGSLRILNLSRKGRD